MRGAHNGNKYFIQYFSAFTDMPVMHGKGMLVFKTLAAHSRKDPASHGNGFGTAYAYNAYSGRSCSGGYSCYCIIHVFIIRSIHVRRTCFPFFFLNSLLYSEQGLPHDAAAPGSHTDPDLISIRFFLV